MGKYKLDSDIYAKLSRQAGAEGCVLLKNDRKALPLCKNDKIAVFGRSAFDYYKSGLGSGGLVNTKYVVGILDALKEEELLLNQKLLDIYEDWREENPFDRGSGWGKVPWSQKEMPITDAAIDAAKDADAAIVVIGRTAGEDQDNRNEEGSYLLTEEEKNLIATVSKTFERTIVVLNVGNIIDMKWVKAYDPAAVLYAWQGGQEGGHAVVDVLMGRVNPCGKLTDTIAESIEDYPSTSNFGDCVRNYYQEDIYVGYRYFETFAKNKVLYPFGYGLSYSSFAIQAFLKEEKEDSICVEAKVQNTGDTVGKEVVQVYLNAPCGKLGKPSRVLTDFAKTKLLQPNESQTITFEIPKNTFASYDDSGVTGHKSCLVLEEGKYTIYVGNDVRSAQEAGSFLQQFKVVEELEEACAPVLPFETMHAVEENGKLSYEMRPAALRTYNLAERIAQRMPAEIPYTGDLGYTLEQVLDHEVSMDDFVGQLSDEELIGLFHGEGMCSPKVTPGTAAAFGGLSQHMQEMKIPAGCCSDGPSGIRMDCGTHAFSLPNGTALGCTFDVELVKALFECMGLELRKNRIDTLLGPGMNIHRNPLNGRNFEYVSEDPLLTGRIAAAQLKGMQDAGTTGTIKHFATNNQESARQKVDAVVSERALREIYLKGFEIAVKEGKCRSVMTTYAPLNGIWTAGSYDLNTTILRKQWGFEGIVMTDWWAKGNCEGEDGTHTNRAPMVAAQNDLYMVTPDAMNMMQDNVLEKLLQGEITRAQLQRNAKNILGFLVQSPAMLYMTNRISQEELDEIAEASENEVSLENLTFYEADEQTGELVIDAKEFDTSSGTNILFGISMNKMGIYDVEIRYKSDLGELAQLPLSIYYDNVLVTTISVQGSLGEWKKEVRKFGAVLGNNHYMKLYFGASGLQLDTITLKKVEDFHIPGM